MSKLTKSEKSWIMYDWANSAYTIIVTTTIFQLYFKTIMEGIGFTKTISTAYWGYSNSFATFLVAILAPILGTLADYKGLKKKFFSMFFVIGVLFTFLLATIPEKYWFVIIIFYILSAIGFSGANIFYDAFLIDVTEENKMDRISTTGYAWGYIGSTIPYIISIGILIVAQKQIILISNAFACKIALLITAFWWGLFTIPMLKNVSQKYGIEREPKPIIKSFKRLKNTYREIKKYKNVFIFLLAYFFYIDGVGTIIKMSTSYGSDLGIEATTLVIILLVTQFIAFPFAIIYGKLAEKYNAKTMLFIGIIIYIIICIYAYFLKTKIDFWILALLVGTSQGGIQALSRSYYGKIIPKDQANEFFGFYNIFGKFAAIMGPALVGIITQLTNKTNNGVFSIIILFIIGGFLLTKVPSKKNII